MYTNDFRLLQLCYFTVFPSERPLHYQERVLPILHSFGTNSHLLIKKHIAMDAIILYLGEHTNHQQNNSLYLTALLVLHVT